MLQTDAITDVGLSDLDGTFEIDAPDGALLSVPMLERHEITVAVPGLVFVGRHTMLDQNTAAPRGELFHTDMELCHLAVSRHRDIGQMTIERA